MTTAKKPRKRLSARDKVLKQWGDAFLGRENPKPHKQRETPEQKARRVGRGLGFYLVCGATEWHKIRILADKETVETFEGPTSDEIALWRALARARKVSL